MCPQPCALALCLTQPNPRYMLLFCDSHPYQYYIYYAYVVTSHMRQEAKTDFQLIELKSYFHRQSRVDPTQSTVIFVCVKNCVYIHLFIGVKMK